VKAETLVGFDVFGSQEKIIPIILRPIALAPADWLGQDDMKTMNLKIPGSGS